jgi:dihydroxyacetone kinase
MLRAAVEGVQKRGRAKRGDKTVLDALIPAAEAAEQAAGKGKTLADCLDAALSGAKQGVDDSVNMRAEAGRSSWFKERSIGVKDPGAAALVIMLESVTRNLKAITTPNPSNGLYS